MNKEIKPKFTLAFKQDAVKLVTEKNYTYQQAADSLGIFLNTISGWLRTERGLDTQTASKPSGLNHFDLNCRYPSNHLAAESNF